MILFLVSFILIFTASYFITSMLKPKENSIGFIYLFLIAFAQIILTFEVLSLFSAIKECWFLLANGVLFATTLVLWLKLKRPVWKIKKTGLMRRIYNSLKLDKSLRILLIGYCVFILSAIFICIVMPIYNKDAFAYHASRCLFWITQGNLNHFEIADIRNVCLPINSELLYSWVLLFLKSDVGLGFFAFFGYVFSITAIFKILGLLGYCVRKRLWVIFILSALPSVMVQASTTETDIIIAGLISSSVFLFWYALKNNQKIPIFMAALSFAIAIGTKTPALMIIPAIGILLLYLSHKYKNYKSVFLFLVFWIVNFIIFSSFNYILNFLDFGNFMGAESFIAVSKNLANYIKFLYSFIDFTGFKWGLYLHPYLGSIETKNLNLFHVANIPNMYFDLPYEKSIGLTSPLMGLGILGFLIYIPCLLISLFCTKSRYKKLLSIAMFGIIFFVNLFSLSYLIGYTVYSVRFISAFAILSSPVLIYSYNIKFKPLKYLIILFAMFYLVIISTNIKTSPTVFLLRELNQTHSLTKLRSMIKISSCPDSENYCVLVNKIKTEFNTGNKILFFPNIDMDRNFELKFLQLQGYTIDFKLIQNKQNIDFKNYNILIIEDNKQITYTTNLQPLNSNKDIICKSFSPTKNVTYPFFTECNVNKQFFEKQNFRLYKTFENQESKKIFVYVNNTDLPILRDIQKN